MRFFYIILLILGAAFLVPDFVYAAPDLPSECPGTVADYIIVDISLAQTASGSDDFIFAGDGNAVVISGGGGSDCILVGNENTANISGAGNDDIIITGNNNSGEIKGKGGNDTIIVGENNTGKISGEGGNDTLVDGYGSTGEIVGGGGTDTIVHVPPAPSASPLPGTFNSTQEITLSSDGAATIFYTTDDVVPVCDENEGIGELYESPFQVLSTQTITAIACAEEGYASPVASLSYTIELKTDPANLSSILEAVFAPAPGESLSLTLSLTLSQDLEINTTASGSKVVLTQDTIITRFDGQEFNAASLSSSETDIGLLTGLAEGQVFEAALQWGVPNITLEFSIHPITISIFVGTDLDGQTLSVVRSTTGTNGWTDDGIVSPATCTVSAGICSFRATKASYYGTYTYTPPAPVSNSGGGGGTIWFPALYNPVSTTTPAPEIISTPAPALAPEITPAATPVVVVSVHQKPTVAKVVAPKVIAKIQPTPEPIRSPEVEKPKPVNKNILSNILAIIVGLFRWSF